MTVSIILNGHIGVELATRLGLELNRREGHDLAGPCIACKSSDAFRLHQQTGVGHCYSCQGKWSPFQIAATILGNREQAKSLLVEMGIFQAKANSTTPVMNPVVAIAQQKGITPESLRAFGAEAVSNDSIRLPAYGPDGKICTTFLVMVQGGKGLFAKGRPAGLFFPHVDGKVRLPQPGEVWHLLEGPKDPAALHDLGLLACGMNTCRLAAKFARLFAGVEMTLIPDRDSAGEEGSLYSARVLHGVAKSVRIAVLPAEFTASNGQDVRDVLRRPNGRELVLQAIADARPPEGAGSAPDNPNWQAERNGHPAPTLPPWLDPPAPDAYHGLAGEIARTIEPESESDPVALLAQVLIAVGNLIGRTAHFQVEGTKHYLNEYGLLIGKSSKARKGTSWDRVRAAFHAVEPDWNNKRIMSGLSSGEGVIWHCHDPIYGRNKKGDIVLKDPGEQDKRLLVIESEYATALRQIERQGNTLSVILRQGWDGNTLRTLTSGRQHAPLVATNPHISIIGHITADEYRRYLSSTEAANGYANRYLHFCVKRSKFLSRGGRPLDLSRHSKRLAEAKDWACRLEQVTWDAKAGHLWDNVYLALSDGKPGLVGSLLARSEAHVMRLACIYAILDLAPNIQVEHLLAALALWDYCERSVRYVFGDSLGDPLADEILRALRASAAGLTRTEISSLSGRHENKQCIDKALGLLLEHQLARVERQPTKGCPVERWFAN